ncbi:molecular chaperone [Leucoagaricus gongylophorus]
MPTVRWCLASSPLAQGLVHCRLACKLHRLPCTLHRLPYTIYRPHITIHTQSRRAAAPSLCPSCSKPLPSFLHACTACWNISSSSSNMTHHDLFGLPYEPNPFVVDLTTLKQRFRQAQAVCHPDAWTSKGSHKRDIAQMLSAQVNEAYQALLRPLARAEYILGQNDMHVSELDQITDTAFMMEIMDSREAIDDAEDSSEVINLMEENDEKLNETVHQIEKLVGQKDWVGVKTAAIRLRYLEGIARAAKKWLDSR